MADDDGQVPVQDAYPEWRGYFRSVVRRSAGDDYAEGQIRDKHTLRADEPPWLGGKASGSDEYPAPVDYLVFGLVSCQVEVLDQAMKKAGVEEYHLEAEAEVDEMGHDDPDDGMYAHTAARVRHVDIDVTVSVPPDQEEAASKCLDVYDSGCVVGQSFRTGIEYTSNKDLQIVD